MANDRENGMTYIRVHASEATVTVTSGVVTSGYRVRNGEWREIGRMSPQLPQVRFSLNFRKFYFR